MTTIPRALALLALVVSLSGCGHADSEFGKEGSVAYQDRPSMELVLDEYRAFQRDLLVRLDERFGATTWVEPPNDPGLDWVDCGDQDFPDGVSAALPSIGFDGTYPKQQWPEVRDLVIKVGKEHHFTVITMFHDGPDDGDFSGRDPRYEGTYYFGMGKNTVFGIETGCHRWDTPPPPAS